MAPGPPRRPRSAPCRRRHLALKTLLDDGAQRWTSPYCDVISKPTYSGFPGEAHRDAMSPLGQCVARPRPAHWLEGAVGRVRQGLHEDEVPPFRGDHGSVGGTWRTASAVFAPFVVMAVATAFPGDALVPEPRCPRLVLPGRGSANLVPH